MTIDQQFIRQKVQAIADDLALLKGLEQYSISDIFADPYRHHAFNNIVQQIIQRAVDINHHTLAATDARLLASPKTYRETFLLMGQINALPPELAEKIAGSGSLRNILVHEYDTIEPEKIEAGRRQILELYPQFCTHILEALPRLGAR